MGFRVSMDVRETSLWAPEDSIHTSYKWSELFMKNSLRIQLTYNKNTYGDCLKLFIKYLR